MASMFYSPALEVFSKGSSFLTFHSIERKKKKQFVFCFEVKSFYDVLNPQVGGSFP